MVKQENGDLLIRLFTCVHSSVNAAAGFLPFDCARCYLDALALCPVAIFNHQGTSTQDYRDALTWIAMPWHLLAGRKM
jgi:hypothetical protein